MAFDTASIKQNTTAPPHAVYFNFPIGPGDVYAPTGGIFRANNLSLIDYILFAYKLAPNQEELITSQIRSLTDPDTQLALLVTQGTIFHSHTYSLFVKTKEDFDVDRITASLRANAAIAFAEGDQAFGTIDAAGKDEVLIAEVRPDASIRGGFWVWAVCDNLRRSSALNAVLVAEKVLFGGGVTN